MPKTRARRMRKRAPRRNRKAKMTRNPGLQTVYTYKFKPNPIWTTNAGTGSAGQLAIAPNIAPLNGSVSAPTPAPCGLSGFFDFGVGLVFHAKDIQNFNMWQNIYDLYRVNYVDVKVTCLGNVAGINSVSLLPTLYYVQDEDNNAIPTQVGEVRGKQGAKQINITANRTSFTQRIVPRTRTAVASMSSSAFPVASKTSPCGWLDCRDDLVDLLAGKYFISNAFLPGGVSFATAYQWEFTYNISFKGAQVAF